MRAIVIAVQQFRPGYSLALPHGFGFNATMRTT